VPEQQFHEPVLLTETIAMLRPATGKTYLDATLGGGGHAEAILEASAPAGRLVGLDRDPQAIQFASQRLARFGDRVELLNTNFAEIDRTSRFERARFDGALLDLGVSSAQIDDVVRGFSYRQDAPLDMRMGPRGEPARDLLSRAAPSTLEQIIRDYGEERTTNRLRAIVESAVPASSHRLKSVARVFQAIRIAVNDELTALNRGLKQIERRLNADARLVVIAYHSLEDRVVKRYFRELAADCKCPPDLPVCRCDKVSEADVLTPRPIRPTEAEVAANPRARSARLRAIERRRSAANQTRT
jgi:16S rRNA (cytosine1402-N4)-methyltransferase